jgi:hypothetical protein
VEVVGFFLFFFVYVSVVLVANSDSKRWPVTSGGSWRIFGGVLFNVRSISLGWSFFS